MSWLAEPVKWMVLLLACVFVLGPLFFHSSAHSESQTMEQKVYLPHCTGSWYVDSQGTDDTMDSVDWAVLRCNDYSEESAK